MSHQVIALSSKDLDITDIDAVYSVVMDHLPKAIIHLAALSDPGYCQQNPEDSKIVNLEGTINVARAAAAKSPRSACSGHSNPARMPESGAA